MVLVGDAAADPRPVVPAPACRPELVLLGPTPTPARRADWVLAVDAWQLTLVPGDLAAGLRPLADRLAGRSLGLVLAGGGARAFAHVGVLRELEDAGLHVDRVAGTSIGGVIAALHAHRVGRARSSRTICYARVGAPQAVQRLAAPGAVPVQGPPRARRDGRAPWASDEVLEGLPRQLRLVSVDLVSRTRQVHERGNLVEAALASVRLPVLFAPMPQDDGRLLVDGGVLDNLPVDLLDRAGRGAGRRRQHRHRGRGQARDAAGRGCPPSARRCCGP